MAASVTDSIIYSGILSTKQSRMIWCDEQRTHYYLQFEACLAKVQAQLGIIPPKAAVAIAQKCTLTNIDFATLREETEKIGYPVLPVVKQLVAAVNAGEAGLGEWAHYGATTQDKSGKTTEVGCGLLEVNGAVVTDTTTVLQLRDTLELVEESMTTIMKALRELCEKHKATPMPARSNLQQAVPISFGFKLARLLATFQRHRERLGECRSRLLVLEFSGAAGTLATLAPEGTGGLASQCQASLAQELGLRVPEIAWHTERDRIAEFGSLMAMLTATCAKFALDVKLMMQTEVGEVSEPYVKERGSSSTMPQKRNPIASAYITAAASTVRTLSASLQEAMVADHERSTGPWEIEWIVLPQVSTLTHACLRHTSDILAGLEVHESAMKRNLAITNGTIVSEAVMMNLAPRLGRQRAHDLIYDLCRQANTTGRPLIDLLEETEEVRLLSRAELEWSCNPANYLGFSEVMTDNVLRQTAWVAMSSSRGN